MKKSIVAVLISLLIGFVGLVVGVFIDEIFGGVNFEFTPYISIIFVVVTMEAQSPVFSRPKRSKCRSSQGINDTPTPFSPFIHC